MRMTHEQIQRIAAQLEPEVRDFMSDRLTALQVEAIDGVRIMQAISEMLVTHFAWLMVKLN